MKTIPSAHRHSALVLRRVAKNQGGQCCEPTCTRAGRFTVQIAGWFVMREGPLGGKATLCKACAEAERLRWDDLCGQDQGYSSEQVRDAREMAKGGVPVAEIAAVLEGDVEVGAAA